MDLARDFISSTVRATGHTDLSRFATQTVDHAGVRDLAVKKFSKISIIQGIYWPWPPKLTIPAAKKKNGTKNRKIVEGWAT